MRVLIDTNVLVSYLLLTEKGGAIRTIIHEFQKGRFTLLLPEPLLQELVAVVQTKRRLSSRISPRQLGTLVTVLGTYTEKMQKIEEPFPSVTRDLKDDYLLAYALVGRADYLVTGDKDLLVLSGQIPSLQILTPAQFVDVLE